MSIKKTKKITEDLDYLKNKINSLNHYYIVLDNTTALDSELTIILKN